MQDRNFWGEIVRYIYLPYAPGVLFLYDGDYNFYSCDIYSGPEDVKSDEVYGGPLPTLEWYVIERIEKRKGMYSARIMPKGDVGKYRERTFGVDGVPFLLHFMGRSTGCFGPYIRSDWDNLIKHINYMFDSGGVFVIKVRNVDTP